MLGTAEILVILCVVLLLFGGKKLPELARSLGQGIREFKNACQGVDAENKHEKIPCEKEVVHHPEEIVSKNHDTPK